MSNNLESIAATLSSVEIDGQRYDFSDRFELDESTKTLTVKLGFACGSIAESLSSQLQAQMQGADVDRVVLDMAVSVAPFINESKEMSGVKNIIVVASGKGGVGKSTVSVNLALALQTEGAKVGLLDADIYGPSVTHMLGLEGVRPTVLEGKQIVPLKAYGVKSVSMGNLVNENTPMVWRGPMVSGALQQLLNQTQWGDIDYLIVDMPPGTGDIQLTLSQTVPVSASVIVTTPQDIALLDAKKGIEMFRKVDVPILGVVENMATHVCSECGHQDAIFGENGGERLAQEFDVTCLGRLPLTRSIRMQMDAGKPPVVADAQSDESQAYRKIARAVAARLSFLESDSSPEITFSDS